MITYYYSNARAPKLKEIDESKTGSWIHVVEPSQEELDDLAKRLKLDRDMLADAIDIYEAPRVELKDEITYVFARYCHPEGHDVATEPLLITYTKNNIITIMRSDESVLDQIIDGAVPVLTTQKTKAFLHILEQINRSYRLQLNLISKQILQFRSQLRQAQVSSVQIVRFIELEEDLNEFLTALQPQALVLNALVSGKYMELYDDDKDLVDYIMLNTQELIDLCKTRVRTVSNIRQAYDVIATNNLNKTFKRLTSIAIFLTIPTIIGGLWGMNVALPFADYKFAFPLILTIIALLVLSVFRFFYKRDWF